MLKFATHDDIAIRTFDIFKSEAGGSQADYWLCAERELLTITDAKLTPEQYMTTNSKTLAYGTLEADTDSWLLASNRVIALDVSLLDGFDGSLEHKTVSVVGTMGIPRTAPGITKLIVEKLASHDAIKSRAYEIYDSGQGGLATDHWLRAERELLNM